MMQIIRGCHFRKRVDDFEVSGQRILRMFFITRDFADTQSGLTFLVFYWIRSYGNSVVIIIPRVGQMCVTKMAPPGSAENEIEQFWRMEMVDMVTYYKKWFPDRTSISVNIFLQQPNFGIRWGSTLQVSRPRYLHLRNPIMRPTLSR